MNQYRCKIIKKCFDCSCCKENPLPPKPFQIWMCCQGSNQPCRPLEAPGCEGGIPDWCPLPYQSERDKVLDETSNGVVLWSPAHIFRLICRLDETELEYLLSDIRWLQERDFKKKYPELRQAGEQ